MGYFGGISHWLHMFCRWAQHGLARRGLPDLGEAELDRNRRKIGRVLFLFIWLPLCLFFLALAFFPEWFA
jgi:hypothetical protein